ncbi:MAG: hypothetical protein KF757_05365 [Phycisphaeraceae bacterium]|nr:hypothetical protein [Phycisphaeraceae bacterium]MCW5763802.1 hypothetical protein [Phycisphaeraceae bacterium]
MVALVPPPVLPGLGLSHILPEPSLLDPLPIEALALESRTLEIPAPPPRA